MQAFPGYTLSDAGAAVLLVEAAEPAPWRAGIFHRAFAPIPGTGRRPLPGAAPCIPHDEEYTYFHMDGARLKEAFEDSAPRRSTALSADGLGWDDFAAVPVHQVAMPYLDVFASGSARPDLVLGPCPTTATAPRARCRSSGSRRAARPARRGPVLLIGLAGGISLGTMAVRW